MRCTAKLLGLTFAFVACGVSTEASSPSELADTPSEHETPADAPDAGVDAAPVARPRLADSPLPPLSHARGSGLATGVVTGRIYDDLAAHAPDRMRDLVALGVRVLRLEIERTTPIATYAAIVAAAKAHGVEVLALFGQNSVPGSPSPMAGSRAEFDASYVPAFIASLDEVVAAIPALRYVEIGNEPDVYSFTPFAHYDAGTCTPAEGSFRYALLTVRVFETVNERRKAGVTTPTMAAFDVSREDDLCVVDSMINAQPIASHRADYRVPNGLPDGLPTDIVSIHGYGNAGKIPGEAGYTYAGGTFADSVAGFLAHTFADGAPMIGAAPVWYTELGWSLENIGGATPDARLERQRAALGGALATLRTHPEVTAAFVYDYRDDEPSSGPRERCGLRDALAEGAAPHPSYRELQGASVAAGDVVAPAGALSASATSLAPGAPFTATGWAIDADGEAPRVDLALDGVVVKSVVDGAAPLASACAVASSARCPDVGFEAPLTAPGEPGPHELAARATDATGHSRVIGRVTLTIEP